MKLACPTCQGDLAYRSKRPKGVSVCVNGHNHPNSDFEVPTENDEYRARMEPAMEALSTILVKHGADAAPATDAQIVECATRKIEMLVDMVLAAKIHPEILKAAMKG